MARRRRLSSDSREHLRDQLEGKLSTTHVSDREGIRALIDRFGRPEVERRYAAATGVKRESARDAVTRWATGKRVPARATVAQLGDVQRTAALGQLRGQPSITLGITGEWTTSRRPWRGRVTATLTGDARDRFVDAVEAGDSDGALAVLMDAYGPDFAAAVEDVDDLGSLDMS